MREIIKVSLLGIFRDRIFQGIMVLALLLLLVPSIASLSMRQVTELAITLSLSLISFIQLLLAVFLGATSIWKDIERRYTFSVLSLPMSRSIYVIGRFLGIAVFLILTMLVLGAVACLVIEISSNQYPQDRPFVWDYIFFAILFDCLKYILLAAVALFLSSLSTSFFLPIFGTIGVFLAGSISQEVYDYLHSPLADKAIAPLLKQCALIIYYLLPNLSGFDLKANAIYALPPSISGLLLTSCYFAVYIGFLLVGAAMIFSRREMR